MKVLEQLVSLTGCKIYGMIDLEDRMPRNLKVCWCPLFLQVNVETLKEKNFFLKSYQAVD